MVTIFLLYFLIQFQRILICVSLTTLDDYEILLSSIDLSSYKSLPDDEYQLIKSGVSELSTQVKNRKYLGRWIEIDETMQRYTWSLSLYFNKSVGYVEIVGDGKCNDVSKSAAIVYMKTESPYYNIIVFRLVYYL